MFFPCYENSLLAIKRAVVLSHAERESPRFHGEADGSDLFCSSSLAFPRENVSFGGVRYQTECGNEDKKCSDNFGFNLNLLSLSKCMIWQSFAMDVHVVDFFDSP
jgi:hypothetical protein